MEKVPGKVHSPAPVEEQSHTPIYTGTHPAGKQLGRKRPRDPGGLQVECEPAVCPCCKEG